MWRTGRGRHGAVDTRINVIAFLAFLAVLTPTSVAAAREAHPRTNKTAPRVATRVVKPPTIILNPDREILIRLEKGQKALEMQATDLDVALRKQGGAAESWNRRRKKSNAADAGND
jgi:hypothetical protein